VWDRVAWTHARQDDAEPCLRALDAADEAYVREVEERSRALLRTA